MPDSDINHSTTTLRWLLLIFVAAAVLWQLSQLRLPPVPVMDSAEATEFSAERARRHLRIITRSPHPVGSADHQTVRNYLVSVLRSLGLQTQVQETVVSRPMGSTLRIATVRNIVAWLPRAESAGTPEDAVLLMSHYDSVPDAPGATDAGNGVSAILETLRALKAGPELQRDVMVLISDAEEIGLLGARGFMQQHPWADSVSLALNFEGRGYTGPVSMFRTVGDSGSLVKTLAKLDTRMNSSSVTDAVFRIMPNDTDLSVFGEQGIPGLDFANAHGLTHYHQPADSYQQASPGSLQHHGDYALGMVRLLAADSQSAPTGHGARAYFSLPAIGLVTFPQKLSMPMMWLALILVLVRLAFWWRRSAQPWRTLARGSVALLLPAVIAAALVWISVIGLQQVLTETGWYFHEAPHHSGWYLTALLFLGLGVAVTIFRKSGWHESAWLAGIVIWAGIGAVVTWKLPGTGYIFFAPLLLSLLLERLLQMRGLRPAVLVLATLLAILIIWLLLPILVLVEIMLTLNLAALCLGLAWITLILLIPWFSAIGSDTGVLHRAEEQSVYRWAGSLTLLGAAGLLILIVLNQQVWNFQKPTHVGYALLADASGANEAILYSREAELDSYIKAYLGESPQRGSRVAFDLAADRWMKSIEPARTDAPVLRWSDETGTVDYPGGSYYLQLKFAEAVNGDGLQIGGIQVPDGTRTILWFAPPQDGVELSGDWRRSAGDSLLLSSVLFGLPPALENVELSPDLMHRANITYLARRVSLGP